MSNMDRDLAWRLVAAARVATLATVAAGGVPRLVPCVFALEGDTAYTPIDAKPKSTRRLQRLRDLDQDPRAALLIHHWDEDWSRLWWVRLEGHGRRVRAAAELALARRLLLDRYPQYRDGGELDPVIAVDIRAWVGWSARPDR